MLGTGKSILRSKRPKSGKSQGSDWPAVVGGAKDTVATPTTLFPLSELLQEHLRQESVLWKKNEGLRTAVKGAAEPRTGQELPEPPTLRGTVITPTPTPTPPLSQSPEEQADGDDDKNFYLIGYGKLTDVIHHYFRRLEKRNACLYLTKRKAKHENLRHVETQRASGNDETNAPEVQSAGYLLRAGEGQLVTLRDEELLVYRAALMCAQFPMLSAPSPPEGASPTPTLPVLHFSTLGSPDSSDLSRTAPSEMNEEQLMRQRVSSSGAEGHGSNTSGARKARVRRSASDRAKTRPKAPENLTSPDDIPRGVVPPGPEEEPEDGERVPASDPINIRAKPKPRRRSGASQSSSRKRLSMDAANMLPAMDSDEDPELAELNKPASVRSRDGSHLVGREHPFSPMVNREMLCNLVRRAFKQTEEQQLQFEQMLKHEYGRRSKGEILAKELAGQLQTLENNAHPFYKPKLFVTRNGYDQWLQAEKQRVRSLIDKFWHFSLPRPQLWRHYNPTDYHRAYSILLTKIICCESRTERREPVHAGKTPSSPLSPTAQRLLTEFGLRYGVGELYRRIVYLDYLARHFDYEVWYIRHCTEELRGIRDLLPHNRNKITAVRKEMDPLKNTVHLLHGQADNCLTKIDRLFQDSPTEGVASLIELLAEVLDAEQSLFGKRVLSVEEWLKRYLKRGFALRYERRKEIHADETMHSRTAKPFVPTPALVNALLFSIKDEVKDYREKFQPVFRPYFDIVPFARVEFYRLMCADACSLCLRSIHKPETRNTLSLEMLGLIYRLNERDIEWENVIPPEMQLWRHSFVDLALIWMEVLSKQVNRWILRSVAEDEWTLLTFTTGSGDQGPYLPIPACRTSIRAGVRPSPFPSPGLTPVSRANHLPAAIGSNGAFVPYRKPAGERRARKIERPGSERSGAVSSNNSICSLSPPYSPLLPEARIPDIVMRGAKRVTPSKTNPQDGIMQFGREGKSGRFSYQEELEFSSTVEPAQELEVTVSVYEGDEPSPRPSVLPTTPTDHMTQNGIPSGETPPMTPASGYNPPEGAVDGEELSPPPLPPPIEERREEEQDERTGEREEQEEHQLEQEVKGDTPTHRTEGEGMGVRPRASALSYVEEEDGGQVANHLNSSGSSRGQSGSGGEGEAPLPAEHPQQQSSSLSEYHTPSPIPENELKRLSRGETVVEASPAHGERQAGGEDGEKEKEEEEEEEAEEKEGKEEEEEEEEEELVGVRTGDRTSPKKSSFSRPPAPQPGLGLSSEPHFRADVATGSDLYTMEETHQPPSRTSPDEPSTVTVPIRFGNILDACGADEVVRPKPRAHRSAETIPIPPASVTTEWTQDSSHPTFIEDNSTSSALSSYHDASHDLMKESSPLSIDRHSDLEESILPEARVEGGGGGGEAGGGEVGVMAGEGDWRASALLQESNSYLFPVSNSPLDVITMLTRLACFTGMLLNTLTPKLRHGAVPGLDEPRGVHDYAPDVAMAKRQASQQLKNVENTHNEFLKKLHKIMCNSLKLYADNLICMDLCCWSGSEARELLGVEMLHHLRRRKEMKDIWGCRHMVEARHGLHPNGIPCHKKKNVKFESITRDMCLRVNNIHLLITIFPSLESHLHSTTRTEPLKPATAFGYISSDAAEPSPLHRPQASLLHPPASLHHPQASLHHARGLLVASSDHSYVTREGSLSWGRLSRERDQAAERPEVGFGSRDSDQVVEYLQKIQSIQLKLLCYRLNKFFRPALSLLLELKLGECSIEKRLHPLIMFLSRHRSALRKYVYPECFHVLMNLLWGCILQDLEEEAIKLRESKKSITDKAQMLLQTLSHLMEFMHNRGEGVPLHNLTPSCEYILALLDVMTRSTDQLISIFNRLSAPQFAFSRLDISRAPVPVDSGVIHSLRIKLHTYKKCFSGKEFVDQLLEVGREAESQRQDPSEPNTPSPLVTAQRSPRTGGHVYPSTNSPIVYSVHYAKEVGQYLLSERILLPLPVLVHGGMDLDSEEMEREHSSPPRGAQSDRLMDSAERVRNSASNSASIASRILHRSPHLLLTDSQDADTSMSTIFTYSPNSLYKFADVEDFESRTLYHSQVLTSSAHPGAAAGLEENTASDRARRGMLFLVQDLLLQRARKEKRAKQFLQTPHAEMVAEQRKEQYTNCDLIFKM